MNEPRSNETEAALRMAISGLSWAVGFIEGMGQGTDNYAARTLRQLGEPRRLVDTSGSQEWTSLHKTPANRGGESS